MTARILALSLLWPSLAFGQTEDFTIKADDNALIFPTSQPGMGSLTLTTEGELCPLDDLFAASDAMLEFFPVPEPVGAYVEAAEVQRRAEVVGRWRALAAKCSRIYKVVRDGVK